MFEVESIEFKTPIGQVFRSTLLLNGRNMLSYECTDGPASSIAGLVLQVENFRIESLNAISEHLKEDTNAKV